MPFYFEDGEALEEAAQGACGVSSPGDTENLGGQGLRNLLWLSLLEQEGLDWAPPEVAFNLDDDVIVRSMQKIQMDLTLILRNDRFQPKRSMQLKKI